MNNAAIAASVREVYDWIDHEIANDTSTCDQCGKCCDFDAYDHRLYVTSPEMVYFTANAGSVKPMPNGTCPYQVDCKCTVHPYRFAGCRIFLCDGDSDLQSRLSERAIGKFKDICQKFDLEYYYTDLKIALNKTQNPN